ncbi:MAG: hypothetical protein PHO30_08230 [Candidatus Omnitrophica bacterium]|nr:hypothetical protein [Candidatus Omnitrophota bacterium]
METSLFIAGIIGPVYLIIGAGMMLNRAFYQRVLEDYCKNAALVFMGGLFALFFGFLIVLSHNIWAANWTVIITIFGWAGIIKGTWLTLFPETLSGVMRLYQKNRNLSGMNGVVALLLGLVLTFFAYIVR